MQHFCDDGLQDNKQAAPGISIIVPVYNTEKFLARCLDSILGQTFRDFEIICVNDGSTDGSQQILDRYVECDKRIKVIWQENAGLSAARNTAMKISKGKWLGFVDSDDTIDPNFYERLLAAADKNNADIVMGVLRCYTKRGLIKDKKNPDGVKTKLSEKLIRIQDSSVCSKIFKRDIIEKNNVLFPIGKVWEDNSFLVKAVYYSDKMAFISDAFYNYFYNPESICNSEDTRNEDRFYLCNEIIEFAKSNNFDYEAMLRLREFVVRSVIGREVFMKWENITLMAQMFGWRYVIWRRVAFNSVLRFFYRDVMDIDGTGVIKIFKITVYRYQLT